MDYEGELIKDKIRFSQNIGKFAISHLADFIFIGFNLKTRRLEEGIICTERFLCVWPCMRRSTLTSRGFDPFCSSTMRGCGHIAFYCIIVCSTQVQATKLPLIKYRLKREAPISLEMSFLPSRVFGNRTWLLPLLMLVVQIKYEQQSCRPQRLGLTFPYATVNQLTNSMAYGTRRFNAAFTGALQ